MNNLLIVDDEQSVRITLSEILSDEEFDVFTAENVEEALYAIRNRKIDVVLSDIILPGLSGINLLKKIKSENPEIIVIMMTGEPNQENLTEALRKNAFDFLTKPIEINNLISTIRKAFDYKVKIDRKHKLENEQKEYTKKLEETLELQHNALIQSEEKYKILTESSRDAIIITDTYFNITYFNKSTLKILGLEASKISDKNLVSLLSERIDSEINFDLSTDNIYELVFTKEDKNLIYLEVYSYPFFSEGKLYGMIINIRDISPRKQFQEEVIKFQNIVEHSSASIIITDIKGKIEYVNPFFEKITGYKKEEILGKNPRILKSDIQSKEYYKNLWETILSGEDWKGEFCNVKKNGGVFWEIASISPVRNSQGKISHFVAVKDDITEMKKMMDLLVKEKNKAEAADKIKTYFLAQISHEIRTPINSLLSFSNLIRDELENKLSSEYLSCFTGMQNSGQRLIRTIDLILNLSEIQTGSYELIKKLVDLNDDVFEKILPEINSIYADKNLTLVYECLVDNPVVDVDQYSVYQICLNIVDNAYKFTNDGEIFITIDRNSNDQLILKISDNGIGISEEYLPYIYDPFSQEEMGYTRRFEGNGLGLALAKKYCEINNINIDVDSVKDKGTNVHLIFHG